MFRGKFISLKVSVRKDGISEINDQISCHKKQGSLGGRERIKDKAHRRKEVIKIRTEIIKIENRETIDEINETKS